MNDEKNPEWRIYKPDEDDAAIRFFVGGTEVMVIRRDSVEYHGRVLTSDQEIVDGLRGFVCEFVRKVQG